MGVKSFSLCSCRAHAGRISVGEGTRIAVRGTHE